MPIFLRQIFAFCFLIHFMTASVSLAQEMSLEDFLEEPPPSQDNLQAPQENFSEEVDTGRSAAAAAADGNAVMQENVAADDALPDVGGTTRVQIRAEGFGNTGAQSVFTEVDNYTSDEGERRRKTQSEIADDIRREAFEAALTGLFPLRPDDIRALLRVYDETQRAVEEPVRGIPTPRVNVETVSLDPGVAPLKLKTSVGHITTLNILDVTGAPWPVQDISWAGDFDVTEPEEGGHIMRITPMSHSAYGNMSIRLLTLKTPITIMLTTSSDEVQYRVDARIPEYGPFAQAPLIEGGSELVAGNALLMAVLDGTPPEGAERLQVSGVDGRTSAFRINNQTYVRTPLTLLSPGWSHSVSSADGMNVYAMNDTPVLLLSDKGRFMRASLQEGQDVFSE